MDPSQFINDARAQARELIKEGDQLAANGDTNGARSKWSEAIRKAPGTAEEDDANQRLYRDSAGGG